MPPHILIELYALLSRNSVMAVRGFRVHQTGETVEIIKGASIVGSWKQDGQKLVLTEHFRAGMPAVASNVAEAVHKTMDALNEYCG
jgi:hypothetical protein